LLYYGSIRIPLGGRELIGHILALIALEYTFHIEQPGPAAKFLAFFQNLLALPFPSKTTAKLMKLVTDLKKEIE